MRPALEIVRHLAGTTPADRNRVYSHLPRTLQKSSPQEILDVILGLARYLAMPQALLGNLNLVRLHEACQAVAEWPNGLESRSLSISGINPCITQLFGAYADLGVEPAIETARREYGAAKPTAAAIRSHGNRVCVGLREASTIAGLDDEFLRQCWHEGLLSRHYRFHGTKLLPAFEVDELSHFAKAWKDCVGTSTIAHRWCLPSYAVEQLAQLGVLTPSGLGLAENGLRFKSSEVAAFAARMETISSDVAGPSLTLHALLQQVSGCLKPWGRLISAMIAGELNVLVSDGAEPWHKRAYVEAPKSQKLLRAALEQDRTSAFKFSKHVTQTDALEILNCSASSTKVLNHLAPRGSNPKLFLLDDVLELAAQIMPTAEIAAKLDLDPTRTFRILEASRVREIVPGGWAREHALRIVAAAHKTQSRQLSLSL